MLSLFGSVTAFSVDALFFGLMVLSGSVFLFVWVLHVVSLLRRRDIPDRRRAVIWTVIPGLIILGLGILGPHLVHNLQHIS